MPDSKQPYTTENPEPRKPDVEVIEEAIEARVSPARPDYALDFSDDEPLRESRATLDEHVGPNDPNAVIVPPEGRGVHPKLALDAPTAEDLLSSGGADEVTAVVDGETVTGSDKAAEKEAELRQKRA